MTPASIVALAVAGARWWHTWPEHAAAGVALVVLAFLAVVAWNRSLRAQVETRTAEIRASSSGSRSTAVCSRRSQTRSSF